MRLIDSGSYVAYITVVDKYDNMPVISPMSHLAVKKVIRLNPNNVLLDVSGAVYLSDFGISQSAKESDDPTPAVPVGTPG